MSNIRDFHYGATTGSGTLYRDKETARDRIASDLVDFAVAGGVVEVLEVAPLLWKGKDPRPASGQRGSRLKVE